MRGKQGQQLSDVIMALLNRRTIRRYCPDPIPRALVEKMLTAAVWAPSAHNRQPWRFAVIETAEQKAALAQAMGDRLRRDLRADGVPADVIEQDAQRSYTRIAGAPVVIVACLSMADMDRYPDERRSSAERVMAVQSVAMAGQNLLLAAHDAGLGACWMCAPLFCPDVVRDTLALPVDWEPQGLVTLGYPAETRAQTRHALEKSIVWR